jgi:hypothetical protein
MTIRDLTEQQVGELQAAAERGLKQRLATSHAHKLVDPVDYKLFFSDGVKAVLAYVTSLPK